MRLTRPDAVLRLARCALLVAATAVLSFGFAHAGELPGDFSNSATSKHNVGSAGGPGSALACRPQDQMWVISTRGVGCPKSGETPALTFAVRDASGKWRDATLDAFVAATAGAQARFWIHGYGVTPEEAVNVGLVAHERFVSTNEPPVRFVVWSWPSDREGYRRV
jgi:hypothetical protein